MKNKIKIVIADDHILYRKWLKLMLRDLEYVEISGEAKNGKEAVATAIKYRPDLVILDYDMPEMNGIEAAQIILKELPGTTIMMLTVYKDSVIQKKAMQAGVHTFLAKDTAENEIFKVISAIAQGGGNLNQTE